MADVFFRTNDEPMTKGQVVEGHAHHFSHATICLAKAIKVTQLVPRSDEAKRLAADFEATSNELREAEYGNFTVRTPLILALLTRLRALNDWFGSINAQDRDTHFLAMREIILRHDQLRPTIEIKAGVFHKLTALEDGAKYICVYANRNASGEVIPNFSGWGASIT